MHFRFQILLLILTVVYICGCSQSSTDSETDKKESPSTSKYEVFKDTNNIAVNGSDVVAYFTEKKPVAGIADHAYEWHGAKWLFSSAENMESFKSNPENYAPQYGGYCAVGVSSNGLYPTESEAWSIVDGKLYLNKNLQVKEIWDKNPIKIRDSADKNWPGLSGE